MKDRAERWMVWAERMASPARREWITAMRAELSRIADPTVRRRFARGCFTSLITDRLRDRVWLNGFARVSGAIGLCAISLFGIWNMYQMGADTESYLASGLIIGLCIFYVGAAALLLFSLKLLKAYAALGLGAAMLMGLYLVYIRPDNVELPINFLMAISVEMTGLMACLILAATYFDAQDRATRS